MASTVEIEIAQATAVVRIARQTKRNALDRATRSALGEAFAGLEGKVRAIVLTGAGTTFCAGLDLKEREAERAAGLEDTAGEEAIALNLAIRAHPAVFIAAVNGLALGGGVTLVNVCDLAIGSSDAIIGCPELGFATYASMAGPTIQMALPRKRAAWMLLATQRLDAATAERWGLLNEVVEPERLMERAGEIAAHVARFDPVAIGEIKKALDQVPAVVTDLGEALKYGQTVNALIRERTDAAANGLAHFVAGGRNAGQGGAGQGGA